MGPTQTTTTVRCTQEYIDDSDVRHPLGERLASTDKAVKADPRRREPAAMVSDTRLECWSPFMTADRVVPRGELLEPDHPLVVGREQFFTVPGLSPVERESLVRCTAYNSRSSQEQRAEERKQEAERAKRQRERDLVEADKLEQRVAELRAS
ncbi:MAG: hypothetical protein ACRDL2_10735 [Gaiellaceae bacterium]